MDRSAAGATTREQNEKITDFGAGCQSDRSYPDQAVIEYVNLDSAEIQRQRAFEARGMQVIAPVVLPEGDLGKKSEQHGLPHHFGWPHAVMIDETIILQTEINGMLDAHGHECV